MHECSINVLQDESCGSARKLTLALYCSMGLLPRACCRRFSSIIDLQEIWIFRKSPSRRMTMARWSSDEPYLLGCDLLSLDASRGPTTSLHRSRIE